MINLLKKTFHTTRRLIAKIWLFLMPAKHICITGSQGKTNTTELTYRILKEIFPNKNEIIKTNTNLDTVYNIPITALRARPNTKFIVFEVGIDKKNEMDFHLKLLNPFIAVLTGIAPVHVDKEHLGDFKSYILEKHKLPQAVKPNGFVILNADNKYVRQVKSSLKTKKIIFYGKNYRICQIYFKKYPTVTMNSTQGEFFFRYNRKKLEKIEFKTKLIGQHHVYNIMAAFAVLYAIAKDQKKKTFPKTWKKAFLNAVESIEPLKGRMSIEKGPKGTILLNDSLRANPASSEAGLRTFAAITHNGRKIVVMGEMGELGKYGPTEHKKIGKLIAKLKFDYFIGIGNLHKYSTEEVKKSYPENHVFNPKNVIEAAEILKKIIQPNDFIYLKSSLLKHIERVLLILEGKEVNCSVISCPFYNSCQTCKYLKTGYQNIINQ